MSTYYADDWLMVYHGDARAVMAELPAESVHCVVTSPPYFGLRDYGTASWTGGDDDCDHEAPKGSETSTLLGGKATQESAKSYRETCGKCGATRVDDQLGLEATPEAYVTNLVAVFREVRRVLRSDGTVWLNLGDSYAAQSGPNTSQKNTGQQRVLDGEGYRLVSQQAPLGLKPKDLVGIPWRVAFALQADGWYLRSDIIWAKPNPMPESVTDRPTKAHEYLFLLAKSPRYYFDADAVREESAPSSIARVGLRKIPSPKEAEREAAGFQPGLSGEYGTGRNIRSVWTIATTPYRADHFATFPPKLVEPCIKAGTSERGVCPECGAPWQRIVERGEVVGRRDSGGVIGLADAGMYAGRAGSTRFDTAGWRPSCRHDADPVPGVVLDCFAGSGTTGMVAQSLSRRAVLIDLSMDYLEQLMDRNRDIPLGLGA